MDARAERADHGRACIARVGSWRDDIARRCVGVGLFGES